MATARTSSPPGSLEPPSEPTAAGCSSRSHGIEPEPAAIAQLRAAANRGDATAQHELGVKYFTGDGVPEDFTEAASWIRKSADQSLPAAESDLAEMYKVGLGVSSDAEQSAAWFRKAADQGNAIAQGDDADQH